MCVLYARHTLTGLLAYWPETGPAISSSLLGCKDVKQIPCVLDLLYKIDTHNFFSKVHWHVVVAVVITVVAAVVNPTTLELSFMWCYMQVYLSAVIFVTIVFVVITIVSVIVTIDIAIINRPNNTWAQYHVVLYATLFVSCCSCNSIVTVGVGDWVWSK